MTVAGTRAFGDFCGFAKQWFFPRTIPSWAEPHSPPHRCPGAVSAQRVPVVPRDLSTALHLQLLPFDIQTARALIYSTVRGVQSVLDLLGVHALQPVLVHLLYLQVGFWQPDGDRSVHLFHLGKQGSVWFAILSLCLALSI